MKRLIFAALALFFLAAPAHAQVAQERNGGTGTSATSVPGALLTATNTRYYVVLVPGKPGEVLTINTASATLISWQSPTSAFSVAANASTTISFPAGTTLQYYRGDRTWQTLNTGSVPENGNLYYLDTRVNTNTDASTTMPLIINGGFTGIAQLVGRVLQGGAKSYQLGSATSITAIIAATHTKITYNEWGQITSASDATTSDIAEGSNRYDTDARNQASAGAFFTGTTATSIKITGTSTSTGLAVNITGLVKCNGTAAPCAAAQAGNDYQAAGNYLTADNWKFLGTIPVLTPSSTVGVQVYGMVTSSGLSVTSIVGVVKCALAAPCSVATTADLTENTNLYYLDTRVNTNLSGSSTIPKIILGGFTGVPTLTGSTLSQGKSYNLGSVTSIAAITASTNTKITYNEWGLVTGGSAATTSDIAEGTSLYFSDARAQASAGSFLNNSSASSAKFSGTVTTSGFAAAVIGIMKCNGTTSPCVAAVANVDYLISSSSSWKQVTPTGLSTTSSGFGIEGIASSTFSNINLGIAPGFAFSDTILGMASSNVSFLQVNLQNLSNTATSSAEFCTAGATGTDTDHFFCIGQNSPSYNDISFPTNFNDSAYLLASNDSGRINIMASSFAALVQILFQAGPNVATSTILGGFQSGSATPTTFFVFGGATFGSVTSNMWSVPGLIGVVNCNGATGPCTTTTVAPTSGGTGTNSVFTSGSMIFAGVSGVYTQNNANLFWDNTNIREGIGTNAPNSFLTVSSTQIGANTATGLTIFVNSSASSNPAFIIQDRSKPLYPIFQISPTGTVSIGNQLMTTSTNGGVNPTVGTCGTSPTMTGTDTNGRVVAGSTAITACTVTFAQPWPISPNCIASSESDVTSVKVVATRPNAVFTMQNMTSKTFNYICLGTTH